MTYFTTGAQLQAAISALPASKTGKYVAFDPFFYGQQYMSAYSGTLSPIEHFVTVGAARGFAPNATFNPAYYASKYADLTGKGFDSADLLYHFLQFGLDEGRVPNASLEGFDGAAYLAAYPAVAAYVEANLASFGGSATNGAIAHYVKFGQFQGFEIPGDTPITTLELTASTDRVTGTSGADAFEAFLSQNATAGGVSNTLSSADRIDGGAGADSLYAELVPEFFSANGGYQMDVQPRISSVETIAFEARDAGGSEGTSNTVTVDAKYITGVNSIGSTFSDGDLVIENLTTLTDDGVARNTSAITVTMDHTDNFNSDEDASDLKVLFDDDYLLAGQQSEYTLELRIVNAFQLAENDEPLVGFLNVNFSVGTQEVNVDVSDADTYAEVITAINAALVDLGITSVTASALPERTAIFTDDVGSYNQGDLAGSYTPVLLTSTTEELLAGPINLDSNVEDYNGLNTWTNPTSETTDEPITVNVELNKVGREGSGGDLIIGGKDQGPEGSGITVFNVSVLGDATKPSNLGTLTSTNGTLEEIYISTAAANLAGPTFASLTIREGFGHIATPLFDGDDDFIGYDYSSTNSDLKLVNADAFLGDLTLGSDVPVINLDVLTAQGGGDVYFNAQITGAEEDQAYIYTTGAGDDTVNVDIDGHAVDFANASLNVSTGAGNDDVWITTDMSNDEILNQAILKNITVSTGEGDDTIDLGFNVVEGNINIAAGAGNDVIYTDSGEDGAAWAFNYDDLRDPSLTAELDDLPGVQTSLAYLAGATVRVTLSGAGIAAATAGGGVMALGVNGANAFVDGYESTVTIGSLVNGNTYYGDQRDINAAIMKAINDNVVLNKLLLAEISTNNTLVVTSLTGGAFDLSDLEITLAQAPAGIATRAAAVLAEAKTLFSNSALTLTDLWGDPAPVATATYVDATAPGADLGSDALQTAYYTGLGVANAKQHHTGVDSDMETDTVINGGAGNDVIVLSTDATADGVPDFTLSSNNALLDGASNETIVMQGVFGNDTVMNFTAGDETVDGIDFLDFTSYLTSKTSPSGSNDSTVVIPVSLDVPVAAAAEVRANEVTVLQFDNTAEAAETFAGLSASVIASLFNDQVGTTAVDYGNFSDGVFTAFYEYDDALPGSVALVNGAAKAIVMVENADNLGMYKVFELSWYAGISNGTSSREMTVTEVGSLDFGTSLTDFAEVGLVGSADYATLLATGLNPAP